MKSLIDKYQMLFGKCAAPKSCDFSRATIYQFEKYCKNCGAGLKVPFRHTPRIEKFLFKNGYCCQQCKESGPRFKSSFERTPKPHIRYQPKNLAIDDMVAVSIALDAQERRLPPFIKVIREIDVSYNLLPEKLSVMEEVTKERWYPSKYYHWLRRAHQ